MFHEEFYHLEIQSIWIQTVRKKIIKKLLFPVGRNFRNFFLFFLLEENLKPILVSNFFNEKGDSPTTLGKILSIF